MKAAVLYVFAILLSLPALAAEKEIHSLVVRDPSLGAIQLRVVEPDREVGPVFENLVMIVSVKCLSKDGKVRKLPVEWSEIERRTVCFLDPLRNTKQTSWDSKNKQLNVFYSITGLGPGPAQCTGHKIDTWDLAAACGGEGI